MAVASSKELGRLGCDDYLTWNGRVAVSIGVVQLDRVDKGIPELYVDGILPDRRDKLFFEESERLPPAKFIHHLVIAGPADGCYDALELDAAEGDHIVALARTAGPPGLMTDPSGLVWVDDILADHLSKLLRVLCLHFSEGEMVHIAPHLDRKKLTDIIFFRAADLFQGTLDQLL